ncbi:eukaryotic translation initiation factor 4E-binding protein 2-like [Saccoglossus kowalevskii]|uniref:Eukaryotic translation initiation factor 4E-binding protein 2-like n=1 Tax=Saccoglossus kowalevskii TaxID=10224 RepID=A0ABM0GR96_SACKO|nr:PREDICTED: eukaryotic translation initiation factor 4E-binding protein 2-like [Saccoglossus kowalevskii]
MSEQAVPPFSKSREIPTRRVILNDPSQMPSDYCTTPGGTIFSTTPGGTRIIYERNKLMQMRNSPLARTPPKNLPLIPGVTSPLENEKDKNEKNKSSPNHDKEKGDLDEPQFEMDI